MKNVEIVKRQISELTGRSITEIKQGERLCDLGEALGNKGGVGAIIVLLFGVNPIANMTVGDVAREMR